MPCPVPDLTKRVKGGKYQAGWKKWTMIDLNTLDTKERWLNKLEGINQESITAMRAALEELRLS